MPTLQVDPTDPEKEPIERAAAVIRRGGLVAFPTETVYGLGANALDEAAVDRIYAAKGRPSRNPLITHVPDVAGARELVTHWPEAADRLADAFWPGPLTLVLPRSASVPARVSAGLATLAVRVPAHPVALALLRAAGVPIVAPSANPSTAVSPTRAEHVESGLGERVELILDAGPCQVGIESTVVDLSGGRAVILRPGALSAEDLEPYAGEMEVGAPGTGREERRSPGMLGRHYSPRGMVHLFGAPEASEAMALARRAADEGRTVGAVLLDRGGAPETSPAESLAGAGADVIRHVIRLPRDATGYARELYDALHRLDALGCDLILIEAVPPGPEWGAIRDRLRRAAEGPVG